MSAYDDAFHVLKDSAWLRCKRDFRLIGWLWKFVWIYLTKGRVIRRRYRRHRRLGEPLYMD